MLLRNVAHNGLLLGSHHTSGTLSHRFLSRHKLWLNHPHWHDNRTLLGVISMCARTSLVVCCKLLAFPETWSTERIIVARGTAMVFNSSYLILRTKAFLTSSSNHHFQSPFSISILNYRNKPERTFQINSAPHGFSQCFTLAWYLLFQL